MISASKFAAFALLVFITGCAEKKPPAAAPPTQAQAPPIDTSKPGAMYPPPLTPTTPTQDAPPPVLPTQPATAQSDQPKPESEKASKSASAKKTKPSAAKTTTTTTASASEAPAAAPPSPSPQTATTPPATAPAPAVASTSQEPAAPGDTTVNQPSTTTTIGQLTTGASGSGGQNRKETWDLINRTEEGLQAAMKRNPNAQQSEIIKQIASFLSKARDAYYSDDIDGAHTLATKAKVLLEELTKS